MPLTPNAEVLSALYRNCLFRSGSRMDAHEQVSAELAEHALRWQRGVPDAALFKGQLNHLSVYALQYGAEVEVAPRPFDGFSLVHTSLAGGAEIECDGHVMDVFEGRTAVLAPRTRVRLRWRPGTRQLIVKVPDALMRAVSGHPPDDAAPGLAPGFLLPRALASQWDLLAQSLLNVLAVSGDGSIRAEWRDHFERSLALFLLVHCPPSPDAAHAGPAPEARDAPAASGSRGGIRQMDALLEFIHARLCAPISLEDLARAAGVSLRTLNVLCRRYHGATPMELLRNIRLDAARVQLLTDPMASITDTALTFGFGHLGRFSAYYSARFNELPRDTQRKRPPD
ncbi:AraC family transcriptional regulator [Burkholderia stagnalis]|uniref:AraC family transcriptional regulator n=1 Tax=Burkholderia stagnalis TaxID=1503054 RepID=UPI00075B3A02|nr:AraC family transcriptional regulator [Burkholderia stagnalis]KVL88897.1 AraC family transcriptional regulator [Burkholderia stagnalis]KVL96911.1 AraC family transcriptional regulator [Burkholderia stagnalis]KVM17499.1 AraC family transcriptional regulator [Burkholderia stagnalis]